MTKKSWGVTIVPLLIAVMQITRPYLENRAPTKEEIDIFYGAVFAFIGSGAIGAIVTLVKKK